MFGLSAVPPRVRGDLVRLQIPASSKIGHAELTINGALMMLAEESSGGFSADLAPSPRSAEQGRLGQVPLQQGPCRCPATSPCVNDVPH